MKKSIINITSFLIIFFIVGEILVRLRNSVNDIPQRKIDQFGIQKYYPNQKGFWRGGTHAWNINELGWPGKLPENYDNLISVIGDSFIENFMNPNECHQSVYLKNRLNKYNFIEAGRSGVSFIESMEISKQLIKFNPINNLIYVKDNDFYQSLVEVAPADDITQFSLKKDSIIFGKMKSPGLKKVLYNWKFAYFLYGKKNLVSDMFSNDVPMSFKEKMNADLDQNLIKVYELLEHIKSNYDITRITLVFHPDSNKNIIKKCNEIGFELILLNSENDKSWTFENDQHWTCYGHEKAAEQIYQALEKKVF